MEGSTYLQRPRIEKLFDQATKCKLVYVVAGAGYGKTLAVRNYLERHPDAAVRWVQLTENDNIGSNYWEHLTHFISIDNPGLAVKLREFGFPETPVRFKQFAEIVKEKERRANKTFLVLDDFHLIHSKQTLTFAERCAHLKIPGACVIIISRKEPEINAVSLFAKGKAITVTEEELRFTEDEIAEFFKFLDIPVSSKFLPEISEATKGWVLAMQLLSLTLKRMPENLNFALNTMRQNVFKLMETEAYNDFPANIQKIMVQAALLSDLPLAPLHVFSGSVSFMQSVPQLSSFIWFDSFGGDYRVHPLYLEFLHSKQNILSEKEKLDTYRLAAKWCSENSFYMDAIRYFAKSKQYDLILKTLLSYPFKLPRDVCEYFIDILEELDPEDKEESDHSVLLLKNFFIPLLLLGTGNYKEAIKRSFRNIKKWEKSDAPFACNLLYASYSNLAYIDMYACTVTHKYMSPEYLKKSVEYYKLSKIPPVKVAGPFAVADIRTFSCLVGEGAALSDFEKFLEASRRTAAITAETFHDMYYGYEDLVACEIAYYKNQLDTAKEYAHQAIMKAKEKNQYGIEAMAEHHLLRISLHEGNYMLTRQLLKQLGRHLGNTDFWSRQLIYDLTIGYFYAQIGLPKMSPPWLISDEREAHSEIHSPVGELIVCVKSYIALKKYDQALTVLCNSYPREPQYKFLFGELILSLLTAVARIKTGDAKRAMEDFRRAFSLSFGGVFETPFIELGKNLHPLVAAASEYPDCGIPAEWLKIIDRKASIYAKKTVVISSAIKRAMHIEDNVRLSEREYEILNDLYHGLSREEISTNRYLSINTIHKIIQSIFIKLDANNRADAIRIAIEKKLLD